MNLPQTNILKGRHFSQSTSNFTKWKHAIMQINSNTLTPPSSTFSSSPNNTNELMNALLNLGYKEKAVAKGMLEAIAQCQSKKVASLNKSSLLMFGKEGLAALATSVQKEIKSNENECFIGTVHFSIPHHNNTGFTLKMNENQSLMQLAKDTSDGRDILGEYIECACGDEESYKKMDAPCEAELDMLDLAHEPISTSRLGCQICMKPEWDGLTVTIPSGVNNFWN